MQPTSGPLANPELTLVERTLLRQANLRASERCAVAELDLTMHLGELARVTREGKAAFSNLPPNLLANLRVSVEDFTSSARALYPSAEDLLLSLKQMVSDSVAPDDENSRGLVQVIIGWAIEAYFDR